MLIAEVFHSIQGEGRLVGVPSVFVRTSGCNLRCWFCDTPYTSWQPEGDQRSVDRLVDEVAGFGCRHVVLTGGEPMLVRELVPLTQRLADAGHHLTIETAGTVDLPVCCDLMSISPKLSNSTPSAQRLATSALFDPGPSPGGSLSQAMPTTVALESRLSSDQWAARHDERRHRPQVIRRLIRDYETQFKFVIEAPADVGEVEQYLSQFPHVTGENVYLMPQATDAQTLREKSRWLAEAAKQRGWRLSPRLHVELWGNRRGV